jgi:hypothetical protein
VVRRFDPAADGAELARWCSDWGLGGEVLGRLPQLGLIVPGVAAGFLYRTDSTLCLIDALISNPAVDAGTRDAAIDVVVTNLIGVATELGFTSMLAYTAFDAVKSRAIRHGFEFDDDVYHFGAKALP